MIDRANDHKYSFPYLDRREGCLQNAKGGHGPMELKEHLIPSFWRKKVKNFSFAI